jgi:prolyl-tRNA editing enzyme YbaK/EbsC (Cys-tRNA(Pro) deacylase)
MKASFVLGRLQGVTVNERLDLLGAPTRRFVTESDLGREMGVVEIDPAVSDTAELQREFGLDSQMLANCVVVGGRREGTERLGACVALAGTRVDVNGAVRRMLDVRKASFLPVERAVELTGMEYGGITPIGLPSRWPLYVDRRVIEVPMMVIGSGVRHSKILVPGRVLGELPGARVIDDLAR